MSIYHNGKYQCFDGGRRCRTCGSWIYKLHVQSVSITTKVVSLNAAHGKVYSIQHYMRKFASKLRQVGGFRRVLNFLHQ